MQMLKICWYDWCVTDGEESNDASRRIEWYFLAASVEAESNYAHLMKTASWNTL